VRVRVAAEAEDGGKAKNGYAHLTLVDLREHEMIMVAQASCEVDERLADHAR
jgi:hypothetical protein